MKKNSFAVYLLAGMLAISGLAFPAIAGGQNERPKDPKKESNNAPLKPTQKGGNVFPVPFTGKKFGEVTLPGGCKVTVTMTKTGKTCTPGKAPEYEVKVTWACPSGGETSKTFTRCGNSSDVIKVNGDAITVTPIDGDKDPDKDPSWGETYTSDSGPKVTG